LGYRRLTGVFAEGKSGGDASLYAGRTQFLFVVRQFRTAHDLQPVIDAMSDVAIRASEVSEVNGNRWNTSSSTEGYKGLL